MTPAEELVKLIKAYVDHSTQIMNEHIEDTGVQIVDKCEHESDGMVYTSYPPQNKCKKCGEFYR